MGTNPEDTERSLAILRCPKCGIQIEMYAIRIAAWCHSCGGILMEVTERADWPAFKDDEPLRPIGPEAIEAAKRDMRRQVGRKKTEKPRA